MSYFLFLSVVIFLFQNLFIYGGMWLIPFVLFSFPSSSSLLPNESLFYSLPKSLHLLFFLPTFLPYQT